MHTPTSALSLFLFATSLPSTSLVASFADSFIIVASSSPPPSPPSQPPPPAQCRRRRLHLLLHRLRPSTVASIADRVSLSTILNSIWVLSLELGFLSAGFFPFRNSIKPTLEELIPCQTAINMRNGCVKKMQGSTSDRISYLPINVIEKILTCMPIVDAVRTSVLSKKWRYTWVTIPELVFDDAFYRRSRTTSIDKLLLTIYQVLLFHRGPILKFKLHLSELKSHSAIDQLIPFVSNNGVLDFILHYMGGHPYKLPSSVFSCLQLEHLELHYCLFVPPRGFNGFSKLLSLELHDAIITSEVFSGLISNCPLLKELKLVNPGFFRYLEITAPNLRCLYCDFSYVCLKNDIPPCRLLISWLIEVKVSNWFTLFSGLPAIEFLELKYFHFKLIPRSDIPRRFPTDLSHLKILKLDGINLDSVVAVSSILCLIRSSPNLEKIHIWTYFKGVQKYEPIPEHFEEQGLLDIYLNRLREVDLRMPCNRGFQLELVKYLLATSPILEKMVIEPIYAMDHGRLMFWKAVTQFRRLSPLAEVFFEIQDDDDVQE